MKLEMVLMLTKFEANLTLIYILRAMINIFDDCMCYVPNERVTIGPKTTPKYLKLFNIISIKSEINLEKSAKLMFE